MAKITDPDGLVRASSYNNLGVDGNILLNPDYRMIYLAPFGQLDADDGVTIQALYSYLKEEWRTDATLIKYPFPMVAITPEQFEFVDMWQPVVVLTLTMVLLFKRCTLTSRKNGVLMLPSLSIHSRWLLSPLSSLNLWICGNQPTCLQSTC